MPTCYTVDIPKGIDFKTYALNCARAFGACIELRDEPFGGDKIPDSFEPSDFHLKEAEKLRKELEELEAMSPEELKALANKAWWEEVESSLEYTRKQQKQQEAYEAMLEKVKAWTPPTPEHEELRTFMRTQIEQSIKFDCSDSYHKSDPEPVVELWTDWARKRHETIEKSLRYHEDAYEKEKQSAAKRTAWVQALKASL